jgi:hypothetical protein
MAVLSAGDAVVVSDAEFLLEHPDKPTSSVVAASAAAATVLARAFVIAFDSFVIGAPCAAGFRTEVIRRRLDFGWKSVAQVGHAPSHRR